MLTLICLENGVPDIKVSRAYINQVWHFCRQHEGANPKYLTLCVLISTFITQ
ncbi:17000_t:CDS:1, partial [Gigaspora rosea]